MRMTVVLICTFVLFISCSRPGNPDVYRDQVHAYLTAAESSAADSIRALILAQNPKSEDLYGILSEGLPYAAADTGHHGLRLINADGVARGFGYYIPPGYDPAREHSLFLWLHGGVNGTNPDKGADAYKAVCGDSLRPRWIVASVTGTRQANWFSPAGIANIFQGIRYLRARYHIDPDRVYLGGVSDGGSGCYFLGNLRPTAFAGFAVWSGFPGMLGAVRMPLHIKNLKSRPWYVVHTGKDHLFPQEVVKQYILHFQNAGFDITGNFYRDLDHDMGGFIEEQRPKTYAWMETKTRVEPDTLDWSVDLLNFSRYEWIEVEELGDVGLNFEFPAEVISRSKLVMVNPRSSRIRAVRNGNTVHVFVKNVASFTILASPRIFNMDEKIQVYVNGALVANRKAEYDPGRMLERVRRDLDYKRPYPGKLTIDLEE